MKRILLTTLFFCIVLFAAVGVIYVNNVYLPRTIHTRLTQGLQELLGCKVGIGKVKYDLFRGMVVQDITLYDKTEDDGQPLLTVREASFNFLILPLFTNRTVVMPVLHIDTPVAHLRRSQDGILNYSALPLFSGRPPAKNKTGLSIVARKINFFNGACSFEDRRLEPPFKTSVRELSGGMTLDLSGTVTFLAQGKNFSGAGRVSMARLEGSYEIASGSLQAKIKVSGLWLTDFAAYLDRFSTGIEDGLIEEADLQAGFINKRVSLSGTVRLRRLAFQRLGLRFAGDTDAGLRVEYATDTGQLSYQHVFSIRGASLSGIPYLQEAKDISGEVMLEQNSLKTKGLFFQAAGSQFTLSGSLEDYARPRLDLVLSCDNLSLKQPFLQLFGQELEGNAKARIEINGELNKFPLDVRARFDVQEATYPVPALKEPLRNIKGAVELTNRGAVWHELHFDYRDLSLVSSGTLADFREPTAQFKLHSEKLDLLARLKTRKSVVELQACRGTYADSAFDIRGTFNVGNDSRGPFNLKAVLDLSLKDLQDFLQGPGREALVKTKLDGKLNVRGTMAGKSWDYKEWEITANAASKEISVLDLKVTGLSLQLGQQNGILRIPRLYASSYAGAIEGVFNSNLKAEVPIYTLYCSVRGLDLSKLKNDTPLREKDFAGLLEFEAETSGNFKDSRSMNGKGSISVKDGKLWQLNLFKGLGELFLLPEYKQIVFHEASADFTIKDRRFITENLELDSEQLDLRCSGHCDFSGALDFMAYARANKKLISESSDVRKFTAAILGELGNAVSVKIGGTIQKPKYSILPLPIELFKNIKDFFLGR